MPMKETYFVHLGVKLFKSSDVISKDAQHVSDAYFLTGEYKEHDTKLIKYDQLKKHMICLLDQIG